VGEVDPQRGQVGRRGPSRGAQQIDPLRMTIPGPLLDRNQLKSQPPPGDAAKGLASMLPRADRASSADASRGIPRQRRRIRQVDELSLGQVGKQDERLGEGLVDLFLTRRPRG